MPNTSWQLTGNTETKLLSLRTRSKNACLEERRVKQGSRFPLTCSIHAYSWVVICAAEYLNLQFPTNLITQRSAVQLRPWPPCFLIKQWLPNSTREPFLFALTTWDSGMRRKIALQPASTAPSVTLPHLLAHCTLGGGGGEHGKHGTEIATDRNRRFVALAHCKAVGWCIDSIA